MAKPTQTTQPATLYTLGEPIPTTALGSLASLPGAQAGLAIGKIRETYRNGRTKEYETRVRPYLRAGGLDAETKRQLASHGVLVCNADTKTRSMSASDFAQGHFSEKWLADNLSIGRDLWPTTIGSIAQLVGRSMGRLASSTWNGTKVSLAPDLVSALTAKHFQELKAFEKETRHYAGYGNSDAARRMAVEIDDKLESVPLPIESDFWKSFERRLTDTWWSKLTRSVGRGKSEADPKVRQTMVGLLSDFEDVLKLEAAYEHSVCAFEKRMAEGDVSVADFKAQNDTKKLDEVLWGITEAKIKVIEGWSAFQSENHDILDSSPAAHHQYGPQRTLAQFTHLVSIVKDAVEKSQRVGEEQTGSGADADKTGVSDSASEIQVGESGQDSSERVEGRSVSGVA